MLRRLAPVLLDLVVPSSCAGCDRPSPAPPVCPRCATALAGPPQVVRPRPAPPGLPPVAAVGGYEGVLRALVLAHKEDGRLALARPLGRALARSTAFQLVAAGTTGGSVALVPVPSQRRTTRGRGHDPLRRTALAAAAVLRSAGVAASVLPALRVRRPVADQAGLGAAERRANLDGAFGLRTRASGRPPPGLATHTVVLVDDVLTTGATLAEAARVLYPVTPGLVGAAVVCATRRRAAGAPLDASPTGD